MAKKVIGIILIVISVFTILTSGIMLIAFGLLGGAFGIVGSAGGLSGDDVETVIGEVYYTDGSSTTIYYEVDGVPYIGDLSVYNSAYTEGTLVTVEYDSSDPSTFAVPELSAVFGVLGGVFGGIGVVLGIGGIILGIVMLVIGIVLIKKAKKTDVAATAV